MEQQRSTLLWEITGSLIGGALAALGASAVFLWFFDLPTVPDPRNHTGRAFVLLFLVMFVCGCFIGHRVFRAEALSDIARPIAGSYAGAIFLCVLAGLDFSEIVTMLGLATAGILTSAMGSLALRRWFAVEL